MSGPRDPMSGLAAELRTAIASGDWEPLRERLSPAVAMRSSSERGRVVLRGPDAVLAQLAGPGPGEVADWDAREWAAGAAITFEWHGAGGPDRRRW